MTWICVTIKGMVFWSRVPLSLVVLSCSIGICLARCVPFSISRSGYFCLSRNPLSYVSRLSLVSTSLTTVQKYVYIYICMYYIIMNHNKHMGIQKMDLVPIGFSKTGAFSLTGFQLPVSVLQRENSCFI